MHLWLWILTISAYNSLQSNQEYKKYYNVAILFHILKFKKYEHDIHHVIYNREIWTKHTTHRLKITSYYLYSYNMYNNLFVTTIN